MSIVPPRIPLELSPSGLKLQFRRDFSVPGLRKPRLRGHIQSPQLRQNLGQAENLQDIKRDACQIGLSWRDRAPELAMGQAAPEHHVWQEKRSFEPMSRTAQAITGLIKLSGNPHIATPGIKMAITFGNGKTVALTAVGAWWREWDEVKPGKVTAEVFRMGSDPGTLANENNLCGNPTENPARYIVFYEKLSFGTPLLSVAVFGSRSVPKDIYSPGLCGTFSFYAE
jgi:hypothetical protein